jgi:hypothetical protein
MDPSHTNPRRHLTETNLCRLALHPPHPRTKLVDGAALLVAERNDPCRAAGSVVAANAPSEAREGQLNSETAGHDNCVAHDRQPKRAAFVNGGRNIREHQPSFRRSREFSAINKAPGLTSLKRDRLLLHISTSRLRKKSVGGASSPIRRLFHLRNSLI